MKIVYTCITNSYDTLLDAPTQSGWTCICFCDEETAKRLGIKEINHDRVKGWIVHVLPDVPFPKMCRAVKIASHKFLPSHDVSIWCDANLKIMVNLDDMAYGKSYCVMTHPHRDNIFDEAKACIELGKDNPETISAQIMEYTNEGYDGSGMVATGIIIRKNHFSTRQFNELWWHEVETYSRRDQISFNYVAWKMKFEFQTFPFLNGVKLYPHKA